MTTPGLYTNNLYIQPEDGDLSKAILLTTDQSGILNFVEQGTQSSIVRLMKSGDDTTFLNFDGVLTFAGPNDTPYMSLSNNTLQIRNPLVFSDGSMLQSSSISTAQIQDGSITQSKIATDAVGSNQVVEGNITFEKLALDSVGSNQIINGSITQSKLAPGVQFTLDDGIVTQRKLADDSVGSNQLISGNVIRSKLAIGAVGTNELGDAIVTLAKIADNSVSSNQILNGSIISSKLAPTLSITNLGIGTNNPQFPLDVTGDANVTGNIIIGGNITVNGTTSTIDTENVLIEDNIITLNKNQAGEPPSFLVSGIEIERGSQTNYMFVFEESSSLFKVGMANQLQAVATRIDGMTSGYAYYQANESRLVNKAITSSDIPDGTITFGKVADNSIGSNQIIDGQIAPIKLLLNNNITPTITNSYDIGSSSLKFKNGHFGGSLDCASLTVNGQAISSTGTSQWTTSTSNIYFSTSGNAGSGSVGIGTISPSFKLHVIGDIYSSGNVIAYSDIRQKTDITKIESGLDKVMRVNGYTYKRKDQPSGPKYAGLIAQELVEVLPEVVVSDSDGNLSVAYGNVTALLVEAIHDLKISIETIKQDVAELKAKF